MFVALNHGSVPVKPILQREVKVKREGALATVSQRSDLVEAEITFDCSIQYGSNWWDLKAGSKVYLVPDAAFQPWNKTVYEVDGIPFVRVPVQCVLVVKAND